MTENRRMAERASSVTIRFPGRAVLVQALLAMSVCAGLLWAIWVTKEIFSSDRSPQVVQIELDGLIGEYLRAQAAGNLPQEEAARQTAQFMNELDIEVSNLASSGKLVLVSNAIVSGDVPNVTAQVRQAVLAKVPLPQPAQAVPADNVDSEMKAFLAQTAEQGDAD